MCCIFNTNKLMQKKSDFYVNLFSGSVDVHDQHHNISKKAKARDKLAY